MNNYTAPSQNLPIKQNPARSSREFMKYPSLFFKNKVVRGNLNYFAAPPSNLHVNFTEEPRHD
jgi:hypothetical protein